MVDIGTSSQAVAAHPTQATSDPASKIAAAFDATNSSKNILSSAEAKRRLAQYGRNALEDQTESKWHKLLSYFWGPLPFLIEAAAVISALRRDWPDFTVVAGLLLYNAAVGFWQDNKAANALAALKKGLAPRPVSCATTNGSRSTPRSLCQAMSSALSRVKSCRPILS
jgi:H+-transporting ATPase